MHGLMTLRQYVCTLKMVVIGPFFGGDWLRQGSSEVGSKPWSPRHVKQGCRQIELTTNLIRALTPSLLNLKVAVKLRIASVFSATSC